MGGRIALHERRALRGNANFALKRPFRHRLRAERAPYMASAARAIRLSRSAADRRARPLHCRRLRCPRAGRDRKRMRRSIATPTGRERHRLPPQTPLQRRPSRKPSHYASAGQDDEHHCRIDAAAPQITTPAAPSMPYRRLRSVLRRRALLRVPRLPRGLLPAGGRCGADGHQPGRALHDHFIADRRVPAQMFCTVHNGLPFFERSAAYSPPDIAHLPVATLRAGHRCAPQDENHSSSVRRDDLLCDDAVPSRASPADAVSDDVDDSHDANACGI